MMFNDRGSAPKAVALAKRHGQPDGARCRRRRCGDGRSSLGQRQQGYSSGLLHCGWKDRPSRTLERPADQCKWLLGDFAAFDSSWRTSLLAATSNRSVPMRSDPTLIGTVQDVAGTTVSVSLVRESATGLSFFKGESYRIGQVGSFCGEYPWVYVAFRHCLASRAGAAPKAEGDTSPWGNQWVRVQLVGERAATASLSVVSRSTQPSMTQCT